MNPDLQTALCIVSALCGVLIAATVGGEIGLVMLVCVALVIASRWS